MEEKKSKFNRPKKPSNEITDEIKDKFHKEFSNAAGNKDELVNLPKISKKKEELTKVSLNLRAGDITNINTAIQKLISEGQIKPFPSSTDIHRMGILAISKMNSKDLISLYNDIYK